MEEFNLDKIWKGEDDSAHDYYEQIRPEIREKAKKRSRGIISRVKRTTQIELWISVSIVPLILFLIPANTAKFWILVGLFILIVPLTIWLYMNFNRQISSINSRSVRDALEKEIKVLSTFVRRLNIYTLGILPIAYYLGILIQMYDDGRLVMRDDLWIELGLHVLISIPVLFLIGWFFKKKYIYWLYGKPLKELRQIYEHLINGVES